MKYGMRMAGSSLCLMAAALLSGVGRADPPAELFRGGTRDGYDVDALFVSHDGTLAGRNKGGTRDGYDVCEALEAKLQKHKGTTFTFR